MHYTKNIKKKGTFRYLFNKGNTVKGNHLAIYYNSSNSKLNSFGICVSKKNGNSVSRNTLKRWIREVYKENENQIKKGINIVFYIKKEVTFRDVNYHILKAEIEDLLLKENLYENN